MEKDNGLNALKGVMAFVTLICSVVVGFVIELAIAGMDIVYWTFADRGLWLILWAVIAYAVALFVGRDLFFTKNVDFDMEDN